VESYSETISNAVSNELWVARENLKQKGGKPFHKSYSSKNGQVRTWSKNCDEDKSPSWNQYCAEIKIRAERRAGELIPEQITIGTKSHDVTLSDLGINRMQSHYAQQIGIASDTDFL